MKEMAFSGWEWVIVLVVIAGLVMWGPKKIPELARSIGDARNEFEKASKGEISNSLGKEETSNDDTLIETARKLGINTLGKTKAEISKEIVDKYSSNKESAA